MTKEDYYRIRNKIYKSAGKETFDFDLMMVRIISKAIEEEREACAKLCDAECNPTPNEGHVSSYQSGCYITAEFLAAAIRARGHG